MPNMIASPETWYSVAEAAELLGVTPGRIRQLIVTGEITGKRFAWAWAIPRREVDRYAAVRRKPGGQPKSEPPPV